MHFNVQCVHRIYCAARSGQQRIVIREAFGEPAYYYGWPPRRVYPQNGKITIEYARCDALNWQVIVPSPAWKRPDRAPATHRSFLLTRHNPDITISLAGAPEGIESKHSNRTAMVTV